ncbi:MAG TPA: glycosyltransferase family 2 protein [Chloroflexota bacterium]|nr:glycosyltransferase family 2 protein [Chloroflexota bacterium]
MDVSIVVPIYNEIENIPIFHGALMRELRLLDRTWEVVYVDDGSRDGGTDVLCSLASQEDHVRVIAFRRNFGQTAAMSAGIEHSRGRVIITMDGDCQNDPADIPRLLDKLDEGYDVVSGWRAKRQDARIMRKLPSKIANGVISRVTGVALHDYGCTLKAYRREVLDEIHLYGEMHRFIPAYASMVGAAIAELPVSHHPRVRGKSKYGLGRIYRVLLDLLTVKFLSSYATKPLYLFGRFALGIFGLAGVLAAVMLALRIVDGFFFVNSPLLIVTAVLVLIGSQTILLGLLAEMNMRTYHESQAKPTYVVRRRLGFELAPVPPRPDATDSTVEPVAPRVEVYA